MPRHGARPCCAAAILFLAATAGLPLQAEGIPSPAQCTARFAADPESEASSECFYLAARDPRQQAAAVEAVESLMRDHPRSPWLPFYLGSLLWNEPAGSVEPFRTAAGLFAERGEALGEVRSRYNLYRQLVSLDRMPEAAAEVGRAVGVAEASGDPLALARARILEAGHLYEIKSELTRAQRLLLDAQELLFPDGPYKMRRDCLLQLGNIADELGRFEEARRHYQRLVELTSREGDAFPEALARYDVLQTTRDELALLPRPGGRETSLRLAREALAAAERSGHREVEAKSHVVLGLLSRGEEARRHFERCFEVAEKLAVRSYCRSAQARVLAREDPRAALRSVDEALALAQEAGDRWAAAYSWRERMRVSWRLGPLDLAIRDSLAALDSIEVMRDLQTGETGRAEVFSTWVSQHQWLAGRFLQDGDPGRAFQVQERMRARALIDALETGQALPAPSPETLKLQARRASVLAEISQIQRRLLDRGEPRRDELLAQLGREVREDEELREAIAKASPEARRPDFPTLEQMRSVLSEDEALLSFQISPWEDMVGDFMGGAWLTVITRDRVTVHPLRSRLANRTDLRPAVEAFSGTLEGGGDNPQGAEALYKALLADGLARLGPGVRKLIVVPDDVLHRLPFAALRPGISRYEVTVTPSATLWLRWRRDRPPETRAKALVLADPESPVTRGAAATERSAALAIPPVLGPLPGARREGRTVVDSLGGGSVLRMGKEASEAFLKQNGADPFGLLHFATHAWTDDVAPDSSYVLLAPGDPREDGLLQVREIAGLKLQGRIVVLSSCSSASGEILRGEGVMGLARAFFQAGAHTVVASLWPLRDDYGAALFDRFYHHLGRGKSVAAALQAAQLDRIEDGAPPEAWAGVVVLGDGDRIPLPGGRRPRLLPWALLLVFLAALLGIMLRIGRNSEQNTLQRRRLGRDSEHPDPNSEHPGV